MRRELLMPKLGLTMTEGALVEWMVAPGTSFRTAQGLFVVESEKAAVEVPADADGTLLEITVQPGVTVPVGAVIGYWDDPNGEGAEDTAPAAVAAAPAPAIDAGWPVPAAAVPASGRVPVTPLARRMAAQRGIDLAQVRGSGPGGRIRARDIEQTAAASATSVQLSAPVPAPAAASSALRPATATEQTVARRLTASKQEIPHFYLAVEAEVSRVQELRRELNAAQQGVRLTLNHFILAAVGRALAELPQVNRVWTAEGILSLAQPDVGMAVDTPRGLLVPVLRNAGVQPLAGVAHAASTAIERAQAGRLTAAEMAGGAITVSNAGMHDVTYMTSIINPGQAMILGVGSVRELFRPDAEGRPELRREMGMVLSADHRVLDGVTALGFLKRVVHYLEQPLALLVA